MTSHDLLLFISAVQKKQCVTLQTNHTDFGYEVSCSFAQFREEFLSTKNAGRQLCAGRAAEEPPWCLTSSSASSGCTPREGSPGGKVDSQAAGEVLAFSTPRTRHCKCLLRPFKVTAGLLFVILAFPAPHTIPSPFLLATKQSCPIPR